MNRLALPAAVIVPAPVLAQAPAPSGFDVGWLVILLALAVFLIAVLGGVATLRRR